MPNANDQAQLEKLAEMLKDVPANMRDCVASKITGIIQGVTLAVAIEAQKISA